MEAEPTVSTCDQDSAGTVAVSTLEFVKLVVSGWVIQ